MRAALARLLLAFLAAATLAVAEVPVPALEARVTDLTGTLTAEQRGALEESRRAFEALKGAQLAVRLVPTTAPETIEQYALRVAEGRTVDESRRGHQPSTRRASASTSSV